VADKKRVKNDGRPPDTTNELLLSGPSKKQKKEAKDLKQKLKIPTLRQIPSYVWEKNSCWLDTSLELLHATVSHGFEDFAQVCRHLPLDSILRTLFDMLEVRQNVPADTPDLMESMSEQRTKLRKKLVEAKQVRTMSSYESMFVSNVHMVFTCILTKSVIGMVSRFNWPRIQISKHTLSILLLFRGIGGRNSLLYGLTRRWRKPFGDSRCSPSLFAYPTPGSLYLSRRSWLVVRKIHFQSGNNYF